MKKQYIISIFVIVALTFFLISCSDLKKDLPTAVSSETKIHDTGWNIPTSGNFHGNYIQNTNYDLSLCKQCHGSNYTAGTANITCERSGCHADGNGNLKSPEACNTCHGNFLAAANDTISWAPPKSLSNDTSTSIRSVGAHQQHLTNKFMVSGNKVDCKECHVVPSTVSASGHLGPSPAKVIFNGLLASLKTSSGAVVPNPSYDPASGKCNNTYCHGYFKNGNLSNVPVWNVVDGSQKKCGSCHGNPATGNPLPSGSHPTPPKDFPLVLNDCGDCHSTSGFGPIATYDGTTWIIKDKAHHINGKYSLYDAEYPF